MAETCILCGLPVRGRTDGFCCVGCRHVHEILVELLGTDDPAAMRETDYYKKMQAMGVIPADEGSIRAADAEPAPEPEIPPGEEAEQRIFRVEGMWCPSCSWVIERVLGDEPGVLGASASFSTDRVRVTFIPRLVSADRIAGRIAGLGYRVGESADEKERSRRLTRELIRLGLAIFLTVNVMMLSFGLYQGFFVEVPEDTARLMGYPMLAMTVLVIFYSGWPILDRAVRAALARSFVMETLIALGALSAFGLSVANLIRSDLHQYFDTASMLITLVLLGKFLESRIRAQASRGIEEIYALVPQKARIVTAAGDRYVTIDAVAEGDLVRVLDGEAVPVDGVVMEGAGTCDESKLTGEREPRDKRPGDTVLGASELAGGALVVRATGIGAASAIGRMVALMEETMMAKNPFEKVADRILSVFAPLVIGLAVLTVGVMIATGHAANDALVRAVTVLVIACPCALGIATPLAKVAAVGRARRAGILVVNADALETAYELDAFVIDKTGTATRGEFSVLEVEAQPGRTDAEVLALAAAVEAGSGHPLAAAVRKRAAEAGAPPDAVEEREEIPGLGVKGAVNGKAVLVGNETLLDREEVPVDANARQRIGGWSAGGDTVVGVAVDGALVGLIRLGDAIREDMAETVEALRGRGARVVLLSGDSPTATEYVARWLGVEEWEGGVLPAGKVQRVRELQDEGRRVAMVGDGANDAAALAASDVGFATGDALTVTKNASDVTLLSFSGRRLLAALDLSRETVRTIKINLALGLTYNVVALPFALLGLVNPIIAVTAMLLSSLTVVTHSARIAARKATTFEHAEITAETVR